MPKWKTAVRAPSGRRSRRAIAGRGLSHSSDRPAIASRRRPRSGDTGDAIIGWDIGGAHIKAARVEPGQRLVEVVQRPCTLWLGLDHLDRALDEMVERVGPARRHAVTMTGELVDLFPDRREGVRRLIAALAPRLGDGMRIFAGPSGFLDPRMAVRKPLAVASANWLATVSWTATRIPAGLLADIGSTTADLVPFRDGRSLHRGATDGERLAEAELVYSGAVRTPLMALARQVPFAGRPHGVMAEYFATIADAHRVTGRLPDGADLHATADGRGKSVAESMARLARMVGRDAGDAAPAAWRDLARTFAGLQLDELRRAAEQILSRGELPQDAPVVGAGVGRFIARDLAAALDRPYADLATLLDAVPEVAERAAVSAPAAAVALLAAASLWRTRRTRSMSRDPSRPPRQSAPRNPR